MNAREAASESTKAARYSLHSSAAAGAANITHAEAPPMQLRRPHARVSAGK